MRRLRSINCRDALLVALSVLLFSLWTANSEAAEMDGKAAFSSPTMVYVWSGGDNSDGSSWAHAMTNLQESLDKAVADTVIMVAGETILLGVTLQITNKNSIAVLGGYEADVSKPLPGARDTLKWPTVLDGQAGRRVLVVDRASEIMLDGITIANAKLGTDFGAGAKVVSSTGIVFSDCRIMQNYGGTSVSGGGIALMSGSTVTITNSIIRNNSVELAATTARYGGGIYVASGNTLLIVDTVISGNRLYSAYSRYGGGIYSVGIMTMINCLVAGNSVNGMGDGVLIGGGTATIKSCSIVDNGGQGLRRDGGTVNAINSIIYGNGNNLIGSVNVSYSNIEGYPPNESLGIIDAPPLFERDYYLAPESPCRQAGSDTAESLGLGDYTTQVSGTPAGDAQIDLGCLHRGGYAPESADIYVSAEGDDSDGSSWAKAYHSVSRALNEARDGTHIYLAAGNFTAATVTFPLQIKNKLRVSVLGAPSGGSVIDATGSNQRVMDMERSAGILLQDVTLRGGRRGECSGLSIIGGGGITLRRCHVIDNYSTSNANGGGISVNGVTLAIVESLITNNYVAGSTTIDYKGGGLFATAGQTWIQNCVISGNVIDKGYTHRGGGLAFAGGRHCIGNSLIRGNRATTAADGVYVESGTVIMENCTVVENLREAIRNAGTFALTNSIVWNHPADPAMIGTNNMAVGWSCIEDDFTGFGEGIICADPLFVDAGAGDYALQDESPCWNAGINRPWMKSGFDLAGNKRLRHERVDIGAYEIQPKLGTTLFLR